MGSKGAPKGRSQSRKRKNNMVSPTLKLLPFAMALILMGIMVILKFCIEPNLQEVAEIKAEAVVSKTLNETLTEVFIENKDNYDLFTVKKDNSGNMQTIQVDSGEINYLMANMSVKIQDDFKKMGKEEFPVPIGTLLGSKFLSQIGPMVNIYILPIGISSMDFKTEFESQGINQTKYKVYIELDCRIRVIAPFSSRQLETSNTILVGEVVIIGDVPNSYVEVPEEDILDVTDE